MKINNIRELSEAIIDMPTCVDIAGGIASPDLVIVDADGKEHFIKDMYLRGDDKVLIMIEVKK